MLLRTDDITGQKALYISRRDTFTWTGWNHWNACAVYHTPSPTEWFRHPDGRVLPPTTQPRPTVFLGHAINFPIYVLFLMVAVPTVLLYLRGRRRIPPGHCTACGYNLTGNVSGVCPECGQQIQRPATR